MGEEEKKVAAEEAVAEEKVTPAVEKPVARHVRKQERRKNVPIDWPVEFDGRVYNEITIRRPSGSELAEYIGHLAAGDEVHPPFIDCPPEVYAVLDDDDVVLIDEALKPFLSKRFLEVTQLTPEVSNKSSAK
jgi:hypothetical protein